MGEERGEVHTRFYCGNLRERDYLEDRNLDGRIILKWIFKKYEERMDWFDELSGFIKCGEFLD
jgi:hypothetical protein